MTRAQALRIKEIEKEIKKEEIGSGTEHATPLHGNPKHVRGAIHGGPPEMRPATWCTPNQTFPLVLLKITKVCMLAGTPTAPDEEADSASGALLYYKKLSKLAGLIAASVTIIHTNFIMNGSILTCLITHPLRGVRAAYVCADAAHGKPDSGREVIVAMKNKKSVISIALATIMLVSLCTVVCSTSVTAADNSRKTAQAPATVGGFLDSTPAVADWKVAGAGDNFIPAVAAKNSTSNQPYFMDGLSGVWVALGGATHEAPGIASGTPTQMVVSVRGTDGALWWKQTTNKAATWSPSATGWNGIGGQLLPGTSPAVYAFSATSMGWLVTGTDHQLWWKTWNGRSYSGWQSLQGYVKGSPTVVTRGSTIDVYVGGSDAVIWQKSFSSGAWQKNWASRGSDVSIADGSSPTASVYGTTREDLFWLGTDGALHQKTWNGGSTWTAATTVPTGMVTLQSSPAAAAGTFNGAIDIEVGFAYAGDLWFTEYFTFTAGTPPAWQQQSNFAGPP